MFLLCCLPFAAFFACGILNPGAGYVFFSLSLAAAAPIGGGKAALCFCVSKMIRDDTGYVGYDFRRKFKENFLPAAAPGIVCVSVLCAQIYAFFFFLGAHVSPFLLLMCLFSALLFGMVYPYFFLQAGYLRLSVPALFLNSVRLGFRFPLRSALGALSGGAAGLAFVLFFPVSLLFAPFALLIGFSLPCLLALMWIWSPVNAMFGIEARTGTSATN
jgi:hypothetical protein